MSARNGGNDMGNTQKMMTDTAHTKQKPIRANADNPHLHAWVVEEQKARRRSSLAATTTSPRTRPATAPRPTSDVVVPSPRSRGGSLSARVAPSTTRTLHAYNNFLTPRDGRQSLEGVNQRRVRALVSGCEASRAATAELAQRRRGGRHLSHDQKAVLKKAAQANAIPFFEDKVQATAKANDADENDDFESPVVSELDTRVVKLNATLSRTQMQKRDKEQAIAELLREIDEIDARIRARERDEAAEEAKNAVFFAGVALDITDVDHEQAHEINVPKPGTIPRELGGATIEELTARENECLFHLDAEALNTMTYKRIIKRERDLLPNRERANNKIYDDIAKAERELASAVQAGVVAQRAHENELNKIDKFRHLYSKAKERQARVMKAARANYRYSHAQTLQRQREHAELVKRMELKSTREKRRREMIKAARDIRAPIEQLKAERDEAYHEARMQVILDTLGISDLLAACNAITGVIIALEKQRKNCSETEVRLAEKEGQLHGIKDEFDALRLMGHNRARQRAFEEHLDEMRSKREEIGQDAEETILSVISEHQSLNSTDFLMDSMLVKVQNVTTYSFEELDQIKRKDHPSGAPRADDPTGAHGGGNADALDRADGGLPEVSSEAGSADTGDDSNGSDPVSRDEAAAERILAKLEKFGQLLDVVMETKYIADHEEIMKAAKEREANAQKMSKHVSVQGTRLKRSSTAVKPSGAPNAFKRAHSMTSSLLKLKSAGGDTKAKLSTDTEAEAVAQAGA
ncbi:hypothetical protein RI054_34g132290 [Pseudoscourfieldia marina]